MKERDLTIRPYTSEHREACLEIFLSNLGRYFALHELDDFRTFLDHAAFGHPFYVLIEGDEVIACGGYARQGDEVFLIWGMVKRTHHGKGYGKALTLFRLRGIRSNHPGLPIKLDTSQHTRGFYEKLGFAVQAVEPDGYAPGLHRYILVKEPDEPA